MRRQEQSDRLRPALDAGGGPAVDLDAILTDVRPLEFDPGLPDDRPARDIFAIHRQRAWDTSSEARCDFERHPALTRRGGVWFLSLWKKSVVGRTLTDIKSDPEEVERFVSSLSDFIADVLGHDLPLGSWCVCTSPKRRHKVNNFATRVAGGIAERLRIPFYEDVALCRNRDRINPDFTLNVTPDEPNVIVFDDIVTTGSTFKAMKALLLPLRKNLLFVTGINNKI